MKRIGWMIGCFAVIALFLPALAAQDGKKNADRPDGKKETTPKKADAPDGKKEAEPKKEKFTYGKKFITRIKSIKPESNRDLAIEIQEPDPKRVYDFNVWKAQRQQALARQQFNALRQMNPQTRARDLQNYQRDVFNFQKDMAQRQQGVFITKVVEVYGTEDAKVRSYAPPIEFDDQGFQKKWTKKELEALKDKTGLPGYPSEFDAIRPGQFVELYMAKPPPAAKKKKGPAEDDIPMEQMRPEYVMVVIMATNGKR